MLLATGSDLVTIVRIFDETVRDQLALEIFVLHQRCLHAAIERLVQSNHHCIIHVKKPFVRRIELYQH